MAEVIKLRNNPHGEAQELLPWFINGTLDSDELRRVEAHLAQCADCRADFAAEQQLAAAIESDPVHSEAAWQRMKHKLRGAEEPRLHIAPLPLRKRLGMRWIIATPVAAAAALALVVGNLPPRHALGPQYRALGAAETGEPANLVVQFHTATRVSDMQAAIESVGARLVGGPTTTGAYLLRVDQRNREGALRRLRSDQAVSLAQPIDQPVAE